MVVYIMTEFVKDGLDIINHVGEIHIHNKDAKMPQGEMIWIPPMCGTAV